MENCCIVDEFEMGQYATLFLTQKLDFLEFWANPLWQQLWNCWCVIPVVSEDVSVVFCWHCLQCTKRNIDPMCTVNNGHFCDILVSLWHRVVQPTHLFGWKWKMESLKQQVCFMKWPFVSPETVLLAHTCWSLFGLWKIYTLWSETKKWAQTSEEKNVSSRTNGVAFIHAATKLACAFLIALEKGRMLCKSLVLVRH